MRWSFPSVLTPIATTSPANAELQTEDYRGIGEHIAELQLPTVAVLEGGYDIESLGSNLSAWIEGYRAGAATGSS